MTSTPRLTARRPSGIERTTRGLLASATLVVLLVGLPWGLVVYVGWPLPRHLPGLDALRALVLNPLSAHLLLDLLACLLWPAWACFAWNVARCVPAAFRAIPAPALPGRAGPVHAVATILVGMVAASIIGSRSPTGTLPNTAPAGAARPLATVAAPQVPGPTVDLMTVRQPAGGVHDSLWRIAQRHLGDGARWPEIWRRNAGVTQPDGRAFNHPNLIQPGWVLRLPAPDRTVSPTPATAPHKHPSIEQHRLNPPPVTPHATSHPGHGISTATGAYVGSALAAAVVGALISARRRRRRAYEPGSGERNDLPIAPIVRQLRSAVEQTLVLEDGEVIAPTAGVSTAAEVGTRDGSILVLDMARTRGLGLVGPGAVACARSVLLSLLAADRGPGAQLLVSEQDARALLGTDARELPSTAGLRLLADLDTALDVMETELLVRSRKQTEGADSAETGTLVVVATPTAHAERRLQAILDNGSTLGFAGLLLGQWRPGGTVHVRADGTVSAATPELDATVTGTRMFTVPATDAAALLSLLADKDDPRPTSVDAAAPPPMTTPTPVAAQVTATAAEEQPVAAAQSEPDTTLVFCLLGRLRLDVRGGDRDEDLIASLPRKQREVLVFLALHPEGVRREVVAAAIWPEAPGDRPYNSFHATLSQLRRTLRERDDAHENLIVQQDGHYQLNREFVTVDVWRLRDVLTRVRDEADERQRQAALHTAMDLYRGDLGDGLTGEWLDVPREALRRDMLDAAGAVVRSMRENDPDGALTLLERARTLDPCNEAIYRDIARIQARLGRLDAIPRTLALLTEALAEIDLRPTPETVALCSSLQSNFIVGDLAS